MTKDDPWGRIEKKLGLTPEIYSKRYIAHRADRLHRFYGMDAKRAETLLSEGYPNHWLRLAYLIEQHTGSLMENIVKARSKSMKWAPYVQQEFGISEETFKSWIAETRNPSLKKR